MKRDCTCPRARHQHGTRGAYQKDNCRCAPCRYASSAANIRGRRGGNWRDPGTTVPRVGTVRRLQALHCIGWSEAALAARLGVTKQAVRSIRCHQSDVMLPTTAATIAALYDELWSTPAPGQYVARTVRWATAQGWVPPMAWDDDDIDNVMHATGEDYMHTFLPEETSAFIDEIAIQETIAGRRVALTPDELSGAAAILDSMGHSAEFIAERLGVASRTVVRMRAKWAA